MHDMRIGQAAQRAGVRVSLIRYYEEIGLLPPAERISGQRRYDESVLRRLEVIDVAQRAGLTLDEIRELLEHGADPMSDRLRDVAERRLPELDALIARAQRVRAWLQAATTCHCESIDDCALFDDGPVTGLQVSLASGLRLGLAGPGQADDDPDERQQDDHADDRADYPAPVEHVGVADPEPVSEDEEPEDGAGQAEHEREQPRLRAAQPAPHVGHEQPADRAGHQTEQ
jgi:MerR family transcriptional regulator, redox-sensitive transcriptional activator SoxR